MRQCGSLDRRGQLDEVADGATGLGSQQVRLVPDSRLRPVPESLLLRSLQSLWVAVRQHLDRFGTDRRGTIAAPGLDSDGALAIESLLGGRLAKRLDLTAIEASLVALEVGGDLSEALTRLGHPPSEEAAKRRADRARTIAARVALRDSVASWPEPWASEWCDGLISAGGLGGLDNEEVAHLVSSVRRLLDQLNLIEPPGTSRTELAAGLFGSSHALDPDTRLASFAERALHHRVEQSFEGRALWEAAGVLFDRVSLPVLVWSIPAQGASPLDDLIRTAASGSLPLHISLMAMLRHPVVVPSGTRVLVVENPRLVEAAAERRLPNCVVATNGNPTTAVTTLISQMRRSGAILWYHGDFDATGISICRRMHEAGCTPWMMGASHYEDAVHLAGRSGVTLARSTKGCGPTPWDPRLESAFDDHRLIVHEEFMLDDMLEAFSQMSPSR